MFTLGRLFSTFTIIAQCPTTGNLGIAIATRGIAVTGRCVWIQPGVGAIATQAYTDPRLGALGLRLLELGYSPQAVLRHLEGADPYIEYRQVGIVDQRGRFAVRTGSKNQPWAGHMAQPGVIAMGNVLVGEGTVTAMWQAFHGCPQEPLEERLVRALEAGRDAGGQHGGQRSAGVVVYGREVFPWVNLRVDEHTEPIGELRRLLDIYRPVAEYFLLRPDNPTLPPVEEWLLQKQQRPQTRE
ncbi:MAG: DUF1028 domain-containing protein [Dehalococcoidia bacterium]